MAKRLGEIKRAYHLCVEELAHERAEGWVMFAKYRKLEDFSKEAVKMLNEKIQRLEKENETKSKVICSLTKEKEDALKILTAEVAKMMDPIVAGLEKDLSGGTEEELALQDLHASLRNMQIAENC